MFLKQDYKAQWYAKTVIICILSEKTSARES